jgi:hypothetical protein
MRQDDYRRALGIDPWRDARALLLITAVAVAIFGGGSYVLGLIWSPTGPPRRVTGVVTRMILSIGKWDSSFVTDVRLPDGRMTTFSLARGNRCVVGGNIQIWDQPMRIGEDRLDANPVTACN